MTVEELIKKLKDKIKKDKDFGTLKVCISDTEYGTFEVDTIKKKKTYVRDDRVSSDVEEDVAMLL